jgi:hypothetical protein
VGWAWKVVNHDGQLVCRARVDVLWRRNDVAAEDPYTPTADGFVPIPL